MHDSRVLRNSSLFAKANSLILKDHVILGDQGYPCLNWLIPPFRDLPDLQPLQKRFNAYQRRGRIVVETAFGALKGRWRILLDTVTMKTETVPTMVHACCILHNFCFSQKDVNFPEEYAGDDETSDDQDSCRETSSGSERRDRLMLSIGRL